MDRGGFFCCCYSGDISSFAHFRSVCCHGSWPVALLVMKVVTLLFSCLVILETISEVPEETDVVHRL